MLLPISILIYALASTRRFHYFNTNLLGAKLYYQKSSISLDVMNVSHTFQPDYDAFINDKPMVQNTG